MKITFLGNGCDGRVASQPAIAQASQQVVFSDTGMGTFTLGSMTKTSFGFWIWCEGASTNPYAGACNGAMYFYAFGITRPGDGKVSGSDCSFTMTVLARSYIHLHADERSSRNQFADDPSVGLKNSTPELSATGKLSQRVMRSGPARSS